MYIHYCKFCIFHFFAFSVQLMQADPHKLDFRSDPLARLPGVGGLGPLGPIGGGLPPTHDLTRPPSLFSTTGVQFNMVVTQEHGKKKEKVYFF